jgi:sigma-B regulation protein RsbU (phosphoserine phosphatase)
MLGLSIGDASGHGLPAALLVRDVVTGLRMGIEKELKVAHVFEKLNRVIHRSRLSSRFVSVFYGELETDGNFVYVNAGHQPPILFFGHPRPGQPSELELTVGGTVIGPLPEARFRRGFARIHPGEVLLMLTDGILERRDKAGEFFGLDRVRAVVRERQSQPAQAILDRLFDAAIAWGDGRPWEDDATIVVLKRDAPPVHEAAPPSS